MMKGFTNPFQATRSFATYWLLLIFKVLSNQIKNFSLFYNENNKFIQRGFVFKLLSGVYSILLFRLWANLFLFPKHWGKVLFLFFFLIVQWATLSEQAQAQTCTTKEFIYLNEPSQGTVMKFEVGSNIALTEVIGANGGPHWYPGTGTSELSSPHGLATDLNGKLYIGENGNKGLLRRFNCDGVIEPVSSTTITTQEAQTQNIFSIGNIIYHNSTGGPTAYNSCTGEKIGKMCLIGGSNYNEWGLSYNPTTELVYISDRLNGMVWVFTKGQLEAGVAGNPGACINPLIQVPGTSGSETFGIVGDNIGNFYVVQRNGNIYKYNSAGTLINQVNIAEHNSFLIGITWSSSTNRLYVSNYNNNTAEDCISVIDAASLTYLGTGVPNPPNGSGTASKAIAILKESCPVNIPTAFSRNVCGAIGTKFYLNQEAFSGCGGIVCGSNWVPTSMTGMTFDACDKSITITGQSCGVFTLNTASVGSSGCPAQSSTFTICNTFPPNITVTTQATCTPNGTYTLTGTVTVDGGAPPTGTLTVNVKGGGSQTFNAPFASVTNFSIPNITSYGGERNVYANFSDNNCSKVQPYTESNECPSCTLPLATNITLSKSAPTCIGITPANNGKITLITADNTDKCGISTLNAVTYDGPLYASATAYAANKDVKTSIPNTGGTYILRLFNGADACYKDTTITVDVVTCIGCTPPTAVTAGSNTPINAGSAINLTSTSTGGISYLWTGPNGFTSTIQNPTIASSTAPMAGTYTVTVLSSGTCTATATTVVVVNTPCPVTNYTICTGESYTLTAQSGLTNYQWYLVSGTDTTAIAGANSLTYIANTIGKYIWKAKDAGLCDSKLCCPVIITSGNCYGSLADYVWTDQNNNGQQDGIESPIAGIKVYLYDATGTTKLDSTLTDTTGKYLFDSLLTGSYKVKFVAPAGTIASKQNTGADVSDSDANKLGWSQVVNIDVTKLPTDTLRNNPQIDAGFVPVGLIGNYVFVDNDNSNTQTEGDTPIAGVKVYLLDALTGAKLDSTVTNINGLYKFDSLVAGNYKVLFVAPTGAWLITKDGGADDTKDSDADLTGTTGIITVDTTKPVGDPVRDITSVDAGLAFKVDLRLTKVAIGDCKRKVGDVVAFEVMIKRQDIITTDVAATVKDSLSANFEFVSATATQGTYSNTTGIWNGIFLAKGDSAVLTVNARIKQGVVGLACNDAWIQTMDKGDFDSIAGNKIETEDDFARACVSVPFPVCTARGEKAELTAPAGYTNYQWLKNGQVVAGATGNTYMATTFGEYTVTVNNGSCPSTGCCPIYVEEFCDCPPIICVPFVTQKTKSKK